MGVCCSQTDGPKMGAANRGEPKPEPAIWKIGAGLLLAGNAMAVGLAISSVEAAANITLFIHIALLASVVIAFELLGWPLVQGARNGLSEFRINFDAFFLVAILAAVGASLISMVAGGVVYFEVAVVLLVIHGIGRRVGNARKTRGLEVARSFVPAGIEVRRRKQGGAIEVVDVGDIVAGDRVVVGPGAKIPVDGTVVRGIALVRESEITGESFAAARRVGDAVYAGTHSLDGTLEIETTAPAGGRLIDRVAESVERAWERPSRWQKSAQSAIRWFVPVVLVVAAATFAGWTAAAGWTTGLFHALAVLLVACPCALGFAVPLAVWMTMGRWAGRGLVAGNGQCVETMSRVDTVVFDKTGTLTEPTPGLVDFVVDAEGDARRVRSLVVAVEQHVDHPVARALSRLRRDLPSLCCRPSTAVESTRLLAGLGVEATVRCDDELHRVQIGALEMVREFEAIEDGERLEELRRRAVGPEVARRVVVVVDGVVAALGIVDERPRGHVHQAIDRLRTAGLEVGVLTGDSAGRTERFDVDWRRAEMTPVDKRERIEQLQARGRTVLFVGDGVNDAAAMAVADVAVDVAGGSELASEVGDIRWAGDDLRAVADAVDGARRAFSVVRFNLVFATLYNGAGLAVAAAGLLHPVVAAALMMSSSMFVTWKTTAELDPTAESSEATGSMQRE